MTQRVFDIENEKDMQDLWNILPESCRKITVGNMWDSVWEYSDKFSYRSLFKINWHDKTEIIRPIQEATEADIGKLCCFGDVKPNKKIVGCLDCISESIYNKYMMRGGAWFEHARRLTKQEIDELI